jgi:hypothetical protein
MRKFHIECKLQVTLKVHDLILTVAAALMHRYASRLGYIFNIIHSVHCDYNNLHVPTNAHKMYKSTSYIYTETLLRVSANVRHLQEDDNTIEFIQVYYYQRYTNQFLTTICQQHNIHSIQSIISIAALTFLTLYIYILIW